jgi:hypothetical protein
VLLPNRYNDFMVAALVAVLVSLLSVCAAVYALDAGLRDGMRKDAYMKRRISARWARIVRGALSAIGVN